MAIPGFLHVAGSLPVSTTVVRKFAAGDPRCRPNVHLHDSGLRAQTPGFVRTRSLKL
jgi:hypothetical protein